MWAHAPNSFRAAMGRSPRGLQLERGVGCHPRARLGDALSFPDPGMAGGQVIGVSTSGEAPRHGLDHGSSGNLSLVTAFTALSTRKQSPSGPPASPRTHTSVPAACSPSTRRQVAFCESAQSRLEAGGPGSQDSSPGAVWGCAGGRTHGRSQGSHCGDGSPFVGRNRDGWQSGRPAASEPVRCRDVKPEQEQTRSKNNSNARVLVSTGLWPHPRRTRVDVEALLPQPCLISMYVPRT